MRIFQCFKQADAVIYLNNEGLLNQIWREGHFLLT